LTWREDLTELSNAPIEIRERGLEPNEKELLRLGFIVENVVVNLANENRRLERHVIELETGT
jgi:hypothetical protein